MNGAAVAAAAAAAIANAIKASGVLVRIEASEWAKLLSRSEDPLVVYAPPRGLFSKKHVYLMSYGGLAFHTSSAEPLDIGGAEVVIARSISIPS